MSTFSPSSTSSPSSKGFTPLKKSVYFLTGFTLVEMMVVVAIFLIMTAIVLGALPSFRDKLSLDLVVKEILTEIRQLQVYGGASRFLTGAMVLRDQKPPVLGLYFAMTTPNQIILFYDSIINPDGVYTEGTDTRLETYLLGGGVQLERICAENLAPDYNCFSNQNNISITFTNPYPQPTIMNDTIASPGFNYTRLFFKQTRLNETKSITISKAGQVTVQTP